MLWLLSLHIKIMFKGPCFSVDREVAIPSIIILNLSNDGYFVPPDEVQTEEQLVQFINGVLDGSFKVRQL